MTEDEAKTKWCCGPKTAADAAIVIANGPVSGNGLCVASACMAWRETTAAFLKDTGERARPDTIYATASLERKPAGGFCGLAGNPATVAT